MKQQLQLVYVLTSTPEDVYLEQAYVSMCSAKRCMPDAKIILVTDDLTAAALTGIRKQEVKHADQIIVVKIHADLNGQKRSRYLKTNVRKYVKGDFLFIDTDTIVVKPLYDVLNADADIAACCDLHAFDYKNDHPYYHHNNKKCRKIGFDLSEEEHFFNTGIIFVRDTELAHKFYDTWRRTLIKESWPKNVTMDQPSFAKTNYKLGHVVKLLPDVYNCQLIFGMKYLKDAKIVHYFATRMYYTNTKTLFIMNNTRVFKEIKKTGAIPPAVQETIKDPFCGIAPVTRSFAGEDARFFTTPLYRITRGLYVKILMKATTFMANKCRRRRGAQSK